MSRRKNKTTAELQAAADHVDQEIAKLLAEKKDLRKQISETARKEIHSPKALPSVFLSMQ